MDTMNSVDHLGGVLDILYPIETSTHGVSDPIWAKPLALQLPSSTFLAGKVFLPHKGTNRIYCRLGMFAVIVLLLLLLSNQNFFFYTI